MYKSTDLTIGAIILSDPTFFFCGHYGCDMELRHKHWFDYF